MKEEVFGFISRFTNNGKFQQVITAFTCGCCYWFAQILCERFAQYSPVLVYDEVMNHFATEICGRVYDISGDVTDQFDWSPWEDLNDSSLRKRIIRDCVMFKK